MSEQSSSPNSQSDLQAKLDSIKDQALAQFKSATNAKALYDLKVQFLGKNGSLTEIMKEMAGLSKEEKPLFGKK
ncbi:MAG: hypothetical protein ACXWRE_17105, partial [Pseudobdellovibrionaceae bacterium]